VQSNRGVPDPGGKGRDFFPIKSPFGFYPGGQEAGFFGGFGRSLPPPPGLIVSVLGGPLPLKIWMLPGQGQGSKLKSRSDGQIINFDRGYLVFEIET
jgi:hypothetical protein